MLKLKLQYFGHLMCRTDSLKKTLVLGKIEGGRKGDNRGWNGWMASLTQWTWVWVGSGSWWWTGRPGVLWSWGHKGWTRLSNWSELNWADLILCCPLLLPPSIFLSIRVFSSESVLPIRWPKYWSFSFSISPSSVYSGLIAFRIDWFDLLDIKGTLKSLLQYHSSKASTLWCSAFFIVQLSHPYMTTRKTIALTRWTFVDRVMSLLLLICV